MGATLTSTQKANQYMYQYTYKATRVAAAAPLLLLLADQRAAAAAASKRITVATCYQ